MGQSLLSESCFLILDTLRVSLFVSKHQEVIKITLQPFLENSNYCWIPQNHKKMIYMKLCLYAHNSNFFFLMKKIHSNLLLGKIFLKAKVQLGFKKVVYRGV